MDIDAKLRYFQTLVKLGYKEIEVSYPSALQTEFDFTRRLIATPGAVPDDVWIQILAPCRENLIRKSIDAVRGAKKVIVHIYLATSQDFRDVVLKMAEADALDRVKRCTHLIRQLTKDADGAAAEQPEWILQFSPEHFQDTSTEFALQICEAIKGIWQPTKDHQIIFNLPSTVEVMMPIVYADQVEMFCSGISEREKVCVSVHTHNDRGCAVAAAEMAQLAGADRVEGCLFGNGERTGNVDLVTLAMNLYTHGIHPGVDFSDIATVAAMVETLTQVPVHPRSPYGGRYTFRTFAGTHQDAIRKGYAIRNAREKAEGRVPKWTMPYLPLDPLDIGRHHEAVIRINSQSGKGGIAWCINDIFGFDMPAELEADFVPVVKAHASSTGLEVTREMIAELFEAKYMLLKDQQVKLLSCTVAANNSTDAPLNSSHHRPGSVHLQATIILAQVQFEIVGVGEDLVIATLNAMGRFGLDAGASQIYTQSIDHNKPSPWARQSVAFVKLSTAAGKTTVWASAVNHQPEWALCQAALSAGWSLNSTTSCITAKPVVIEKCLTNVSVGSIDDEEYTLHPSPL